MACVDANTVAAWFDGELSPDDRARVDAHIDACEECRELFVELGRGVYGDGDEGGPKETGAQGPITTGEHIGRYIVLEWLGAGGMGVVYGAYDPELDRRVAIKLLHQDGGGEEGQSRLLREAKALAQVSHPNVVGVYDVGIHSGAVFVAMEYVRGTTLAAWLSSDRRDWRSIVEHFVAASRGLVATHVRDLVHRDFKPSNVLVGDDGRVRVTDFGLARSTGKLADPGGNRSWNGTPAYMSPEQRAGKPVDARSDQYSFCVALYEALFGAFPNDPSPRKIRSGVPRHIRAALSRGMAELPENRFPSMEALNRALSRDRRRVMGMVAAGASILLIAGFTASYAKSGGNACDGASRKLLGIWDAQRKEAVGVAFDRTGLSYSGDAFQAVGRALDAYAAHFTRMHTESCEATRIQGTQSAELMELRVECLDNAARELRSLVDVLVQADAKTVEKSVSAIVSLPNLEVCADAATLRARIPAPVSPLVRAEVLRLKGEVARSLALCRAGRYGEADAVVRPLLEPARATGDHSLEAYADYASGLVQGRMGDFATADTLLYDAVSAAELARDDVVKAEALVQLTYLFAQKESKLDDAARTGQLAAAVLTRLPEEVDLLANLEDSLASVDAEKGRTAEADVRGQRALAMREKAFGPDDFRVGVSLNNCSKSLFLRGDLEKSLDYQERAERIFVRSMGPRHPMVGLALINAALSELQLRRLDAALRDAKGALSLWLELLGPDHPDLVNAQGIVATVLKDQGKAEQALPYSVRALELAEKVFPGDHLNKINALNTLGQIKLALGDVEEAALLHARALSMCAKLGDPPDETAESLNDLGAAYLRAGRVSEAVHVLDRAENLRASQPTDAGELAETRLSLAQALAMHRDDPKRARALAEKARDAFAALPGREAELKSANGLLAGEAPNEKPGG